ncbi:MAG: hypothetical protein ACT4QF_14885 [Sporichthyaceae bacterium]
MPHRSTVAAAALTVALGLSGCGVADRPDAVAQAAPAAKPYDGPLDGKNAAAKALECDGKVFRKSMGLNPDEEIESAKTPEGALANWDGDAMPFSHPMARDGYGLAARTADRAMFTYSFEGKVRSVAIAVKDTDPKTYLKGWGVLDAAWCDPAEFPADLDATGYWEIWTDRDGKRVPTTVLHSGPGSKHCAWESATFIFLSDRTWYVRDPEGLFVREQSSAKPLLKAAYDADAELPAAAKDTGYRRDGKRLYLTENVAYLRYADHVEAWPRATKGWGCA